MLCWCHSGGLLCHGADRPLVTQSAGLSSNERAGSRHSNPPCIGTRNRLRRFHHLAGTIRRKRRSEEQTSELQSLMRISYAVFCLKKKKNHSTYIQNRR